MRVWKYRSKADGCPGNEVHTDNTLLTLAPAGSAVGLGCFRVRDGQRVQPEAHLRPNDVLVFAGDALAYLTAGRVPALVHWVDAPDDDVRLSIPFFLRPRLDARLEPQEPAGRAAPQDVGVQEAEERDGGGVRAMMPRLPAITQWDLERNVGGLRDRFPWKAAPYYSTHLVLEAASSVPKFEPSFA